MNANAHLILHSICIILQALFNRIGVMYLMRPARLRDGDVWPVNRDAPDKKGRSHVPAYILLSLRHTLLIVVVCEMLDSHKYISDLSTAKCDRLMRFYRQNNS